jgi:predicted kinase
VLELVLLVGLQASGKTSFYRRRLAATHVLVSKDLMPNARRRDQRQLELVRQALAAGRSVVVDNTNPDREGRAPLIAVGHQLGARVVGCAFESEMAACLARNAAREGRARVPPVALFATRRRLQWPTKDEGFDALCRVRLVPPDEFAVEPLD